MTWQEPPPLDATARHAAFGCLRIAGLLRRVGVESAWRFRPGPDRALDHARALLDGGGIVCEVGFPVDDLAAAADDDAAATELAEQAVAVWRQKSVS